MNVQAMGDIREMSFQNVVDQILKPNNVNVGGFPEEIFQTLTEEEKERLACNICFMVVNDSRQCQNQHLFCKTCIFAWTMTYGENSQRCPVCRSEQTEYKESREVNKQLQDKLVRCPEDKCTFKAPLKVFLMHGHGKARYSNTHVDFEKLRPQRPDGARLLVLPNLNVTGDTRRERAESIRSQLQQGRMMIHQMMLLLHLEMQLRQQAVTSFQQATDPTTRLHRLDEVMALNEQLNEVGVVLSTMLNSPINSIIAANRIIQESSTSHGSGRPFDWETPLGTRRREQADDDEDDDSDSSISSEESVDILTASRNALSERRTLTSNRLSNTTQSSTRTGTEVQRDRPLRRSEIRESLLQTASNRNTADNEDIPEISEGRHLSDYSQANIASASTVTTDIHPRVLLGREQTPRRSVTLRQDETTRSTTQTTTTAANVGAGSSTTQRLTSAGTSRVGLNTTVNGRNQTLPSVTRSRATTQEPSVSNTTVVPNSVARQQESVSSSSRPTGSLTAVSSNQGNPLRQQTPRPPSAVASSTLVGHRSFTPRPPSSQPSEADEPDDHRTVLPRGSTAYREVQQMLNSQRPENRDTANRADNRETAHTGGSTLSRSSVSNTLGGSRNEITRTSVAQRVTAVETRNNTIRTTSSNTENNSTSNTPRYQERSRPAMLTADATNLASSVTRPRAGNGLRAINDTTSSTNNFGSLERNMTEQNSNSSATTTTTKRGAGTRKRTTSLNRGTERRPTLTEQSPTRNHANQVHTNTRNTGSRQLYRAQQNVNVSDKSIQRGQAAQDGQLTRRSTNGTVPKIRNPINTTTAATTAGATRAGAHNNGRTVYRARRRSEIQEDLRRVRNTDT